MTDKRTTKLRVVAGVAMLSIVASACGSDKKTDPKTDTTKGGETTTTVGGKVGGEFIDGASFSAVPPHIDPLLVSELDGAQVSTALYDGLTEFADLEAGPELRPLIAESFTPNADASVWTFKIRKDRKFSNGEPVLPSSFARAWNIAVDPEFAADYSYLFALVKGFDEVQEGKAKTLSGVVSDDAAMTLTVTLTQPYGDFPSVVSHTIFVPMPKVRDELKDQSQWEKGVMVGNGPFKLEKAQTDQEIVIVRNDSWAGDVYGNTSAKLDKVTFKISQDLDSMYAALEAGETMNSSIPTGKFTEATEKYGYVSVAQLASYHYVFGMRDTDPLGGEKNLLLRQAISEAIDRDAINETVYDGSRENSTSITPPGIPGQKKDLCKHCEFSLDGAKALLKQFTDGGGKIPTDVKLSFNSGSGHEDVVALVQANLKDLGIETKLNPLSSETYFDDLRKDGCPGICRAGWFFDYPIYDNGMYDLFFSTSEGNNLGKYNSKKFDELVDKARRTSDNEQRFASFQAAEDQLLNVDTAVIPINWYKSDHVFDEDKVVNYKQEALGWVRYETLSLK